MKILKSFILMLSVFLLTCQPDSEFEKSKPPIDVSMKFQVDGGEKVAIARFEYDKKEKRYVLNSDEIGETKAINTETKEEMSVYFLKFEGDNSKQLFEIKRGYYGYSGETGCYYYGTLVIADNGESFFQPDTGIYSILNPPLCGYWFA